jgi:hypothetical protein
VSDLLSASVAILLNPTCRKDTRETLVAKRPGAKKSYLLFSKVVAEE